MATSYRDSTHFQLWTKSAEELAEARARHRIAGSPTDEEESTLYIFFSDLIVSLSVRPWRAHMRHPAPLCGTGDLLRGVQSKLDLAQRVAATGAVLFRRFILLHGWGAAHPALVALTAVYIAIKTEECGQLSVRRFLLKGNELLAAAEVRDIIGSTNVAAQELIEFELLLLNSIVRPPLPPRAPLSGLPSTSCTGLLQRCQTVVFHPYRPLLELARSEGGTVEQQVLPTAWQIVNDACGTDLGMQHPPHLIAAAALQLASTMENVDISRWLAGSHVNLEALVLVVQGLIDHFERLAGYSAAEHAAPAFARLSAACRAWK